MGSTKVRLCKILNTETNVLILDEPTNHLDVEAKEELNQLCRNIKEPFLWYAMSQNFMRGWQPRYGIVLHGVLKFEEAL